MSTIDIISMSSLTPRGILLFDFLEDPRDDALGREAGEISAVVMVLSGESVLRYPVEVVSFDFDFLLLDDLSGVTSPLAGDFADELANDAVFAPLLFMGVVFFLDLPDIV